MSSRNHISVVLAVIAFLACAAPGLRFAADRVAVSVEASTGQPPSQDDEFVPVKDLGNQEQLPAAPLVIGAYAVAWVAVFLYLWSIWRRLSRVEGEIASLTRRVGAGSRTGGAH